MAMDFEGDEVSSFEQEFWDEQSDIETTSVKDPLPWLHPLISFPELPIDRTEPQLVQRSEALALFLYSIHHSVKPSQQTKLLAYLERDPGLLYALELTRETLIPLIDCNPNLASELLRRMTETFRFQELLLPVILHLDVSLGSILAVHGLSQSLNSNDIWTFLTHGFSDCEKETDESLQSRKATLVIHGIFSEGWTTHARCRCVN